MSSFEDMPLSMELLDALIQDEEKITEGLSPAVEVENIRSKLVNQAHFHPLEARGLISRAKISKYDFDSVMAGQKAEV